MKNIIWLILSLFNLLFGCNTKKIPPKVLESPRFPATDNPKIMVTAFPLTDGFDVVSFYIATDKQNIYVLGRRMQQKVREKESLEKQPYDPEYMDYRLLCLDTNGQTKYYKDMLNTDWIYGGTFGLIEGELLLHIGDWFFVLEPTTFVIKEKIPIHDSKYIPWKETERTRNEHESDYKAKFDAVLKNSKTCNFLKWSPTSECYIVVETKVGNRTAWQPFPYEDNLLEDLKQRFESLQLTLNPQVLVNESNNYVIKEAAVQLRELEYLSGGTQFNYPNYKSRSILQYELNMKNQKVHFSTSDKDQHNLHLDISDNFMLSMADGSTWVGYENVLYKIH